MKLRLFDTFTRSLRDFEPLNPGQVGIYACGPTVYDYAHLGNLRTYIFEDILRRVLEFNGYTVKHVINITDVGHLVSDADTGEDKMEKGARRTGLSAWDIAKLYTDAFIKDMIALNILQPTIWCKATDHIQDQIDFIRCIEKKGYTYITTDGVYFDTSKLENYGYLGRLDIEGLRAGSRIDMGEKRNHTDFALWKFSPNEQKRQMEWESPWGLGFPGWHIECSAMSAKYLGTFFDIHCGGEDHISVHHTNEIAQTEACYATRLANFWMHGFFLQLDTEKMSKSSGVFLRLQTLMDKHYDPLAYRFYCLSAHYRSKLKLSWKSLDASMSALNKLREHVYEWGSPSNPNEEFIQQFYDEINDDLNIPRALALVWELVKSNLPSAVKKATILEYDKVLGLNLGLWQPVDEPVSPEIVVLVENRTQARADKNWNEADKIRMQIIKLGYELEDTDQGVRIRRRKVVTE